MVSMKIIEIHPVCWSYQGEHLRFFSEFFIHIYTQKWAQKVKKRDLRIFQVEKHAI